MRRLKALITCIILIKTGQIQSVTLVYNLRIAQTTRRQLQQQTKETRNPHTFAITPTNQIRKSKDQIRELFTGAIGTYIYSPGDWYFRLAAAGGRIKRKVQNTSQTRTQTDDVLLTLGYGKSISDNTTITVSGMVGIPTHKDFILESPQVGVGHVGYAIQFDSAYSYKPESNSIITAARYLLFSSKTITFQDIIFNFNPGKFIDLLIAHNIRWEHQSFEIGYNPTFAFGAKIRPLPTPDFLKRATFIKSSFYAAYQYGFKINTMTSAITIGASYGFDHEPKKVGNKYTFAAWLTWGINF